MCLFVQAVIPRAGSVITCEVLNSCPNVDSSALTGGDTDGCCGDFCEAIPVYADW